MEQTEIATVAELGEKSARSSRKPLLAVIAVASMVYLAGLVQYARVRPVDADEGYYATAARLVWEGRTPYRDFAYPQAPLLPYIYSWTWAVHPRSFESMRILSAAFGGLGVFLWGVSLSRAKRLSTKVALVTFIVVLLNPYWVSWHTTVKTQAFVNLLMSVTMICLYAGLHSGRRVWYFLAGAALGTCASTRGFYGPLVPLVLVWLLYWERRESKPPYPKTLTFLGGAACGLLPMIFSFVSDPQAFMFNNVQYHRLLFSNISFRHTVHMDVDVLSSLLNPLHPLAAHYFTIELLLVVLGALSLWKLRGTPEAHYTGQEFQYFVLTALMLVVYIGTTLLPLPVGDQYFDSPLVPFLIPFVAEGLRVILARGKIWALVLAVLAPVLFVHEFRRGAQEFGRIPETQLSSYRRVSQAIEANSRTDDVVLSFWPGYVFESGRPFFPGTEDQFNFYIANNLNPAARARYHILSMDEILRALSTGAVKVVVTSSWILDNRFYPEQLRAFRAALRANYSLAGQFDSVGVYRLRSDRQP